ncbi:hypothetical protein HK102_002638 [Quaeritorhiza haematococci]|nr:hypothetical protein HK102_002638 [Quaeritorhiza haematococci]
MPQAVERNVLQFLQKPPDSIRQLEGYLGAGYRLPVELKTDWIEHGMDCEPAAIELLLENGALGDHNLTAYYFDPPFHCSWLPRVLWWGIPVDLDGLLVQAVDYTTKKYEPIEEDRILNKFDPRAQYQAQCFIQQLLDLGANPNVITRIPTDPGVIPVLMLHGADPDAAGWSRRFETGVWGSEAHIVKTWAHYGWLPPAQHAGLKKMIEHRKMDFAIRMTAMFPEILADDYLIFHEIVKWYVESGWTLNRDLIERALSTGCLVDSRSVLLCIRGNQRDIARKALYQRQITWTYPSEVEKLGISWGMKLVQDLIPLRFIEDRRPFWADHSDSDSAVSGSGDSDSDSGDSGSGDSDSDSGSE